MDQKSHVLSQELTDAVMRHTRVVSFSSSTCGNCGRGGRHEPLDNGSNRCLHCDAQWVFCAFEMPIFYEKMRPTKESMEKQFPGLDFIGIASGSVMQGYHFGN